VEFVAGDDLSHVQVPDADGAIGVADGGVAADVAV